MPRSMLIKNLVLRGQSTPSQILIEDGIITAIEENHIALKQLKTITDYTLIDAEGGMATPPFCEPHIHLDTTQTAGEPSWNISGTLFEGIERWSERKAMLTLSDVKNRAKQTLK